LSSDGEVGAGRTVGCWGGCGELRFYDRGSSNRSVGRRGNRSDRLGAAAGGDGAATGNDRLRVGLAPARTLGDLDELPGRPLFSGGTSLKLLGGSVESTDQQVVGGDGFATLLQVLVLVVALNVLGLLALEVLALVGAFAVLNLGLLARTLGDGLLGGSRALGYLVRTFALLGQGGRG